MTSYTNFKIQTIQKNRLNIIFFFIFIFACIIILRLFELQIIKGNYYFSLAKKQHTAQRSLEGKRGKILVEDYFTGKLIPLAQNEKLGLVFATPKYIQNPKETAEKLASLLEPDPEKIENFKQELEKILSNKDDPYVIIKRKVPTEIIKEIEKMEIDGIGLEYEYWRVYPQDTLASTVLGFVNYEKEGQYGVEGYFNEILKPNTNFEYIERDVFGNPIIKDIKDANIITDGADIVLTINPDIQYQVEKTLKKGVEGFEAEWGDITIMNPHTGEIIAMASYPNFNPNEFYKYNPSHYLNHATSDNFEPGSVLKIITMAAGLNEGKIEPETVFQDTGSITIEGHTIYNADRKAHGKNTMIQVLEKSLNLGAIFVMKQIGFEIFYQYLKKFGFGIPTGIEVFGESGGLLKEYKELSEINFATMSFGQGIGVTSIQMVTAASVIANGGKLIQPHIIKKIIKPDGSTETITPKIIREVITPQTAAKLTGMMVSVVERGTGYLAKIPGYRIAGKTGTAEIPKSGGGYSDQSIHSFIFFAPADNPQFVGFIKLYNPKRRFSSTTTPPLAKEICQFLFQYYKIPPK